MQTIGYLDLDRLQLIPPRHWTVRGQARGDSQRAILAASKSGNAVSTLPMADP
jgi:hypothetical protein